MLWSWKEISSQKPDASKKKDLQMLSPVQTPEVLEMYRSLLHIFSTSGVSTGLLTPEGQEVKANP